MRRLAPAIRNRRIRFALVGCGRIGRIHADAIASHAERSELVDVCDSDEASAIRASQGSNARPFTNLDEMLEATTADAVVLATPSGLHCAQAIAVAATGRHAITEKPMATRLQDGLRMLEACDAAGVRLFVVLQNRLHPTLRLLKQAIDSGRFRRIYMVNINVFWTRPQDYYDEAAWRGTQDLDGGTLMTQASHYVDLLDWLFGPVESVQAYTATLARDIEVEDTAVVSVRWRSGALGSVNVTTLTYPRNLEASITVIGEMGTVRIGGVALNKVEHWQFAEPRDNDPAVAAVGIPATATHGQGHHDFYGRVIDVLRGEAEPDTDGREGLKSVELLAAAHLSARDGRSVRLPLDT